MDSSKLLGILASRKFWASIIGVLITLGVWSVSDADTDKILDVIAIIVSAFTVGTGIESGMERMNRQ